MDKDEFEKLQKVIKERSEEYKRRKEREKKLEQEKILSELPNLDVRKLKSADK